jgi:thiaminase/transcriptional activator TenA
MLVDKWKKNSLKYWEQSLEHPFVKGIMDGSLSMERFKYYLIQDAHYLRFFNGMFLAAAELTENDDDRVALVSFAHSLKLGEEDVREFVLDELGITPEEIDNTPISPNAYHYITHMELQVATGDVARIYASLLPCTWLYLDVFTTLSSFSIDVPIFEKFVSAYQADEYEKVLEWQKSLTEKAALASQTPPEELEEIFKISSYEEVCFWQMAWDLQKY